MNIAICTLGCKVNQYETQAMERELVRRGHALVPFEGPADAYIVNTCTVTAVSDKKSRQMIRRARKQSPDAVVAVCGCYPQTHPQDAEALDVDLVAGTGDRMRFLDLLEDAAREKEPVVSLDEALRRRTFEPLPAGGLEGRTRAMLKVEDGCVNFCTYCIIPRIRGPYRSIPMEALLEEASRLASQGVKELILVAQETTLYGLDLYGEKRLPALLRELCKIKSLRWIRVQYCYPEEITKELIEVFKEEPKLCHYLDLPIQHASDSILKRMGRKTTRADLEQMIADLREAIPDICLRTTLITGFPGETQQDHEELLSFIDACEFDRLGVFTYSQEEDTPAALMPDQIPEEVKKDRQAELMELQQEIAFEKAEAMTGRELEVLIEGRVSDENAYVGRTYRDAPDVDGYIFINTEETLVSGDFAKVRVTGAYEYDLIGELI